MDSTSPPAEIGLKYISQSYHFQYDGSAVFERCTKSLKNDAKAGHLILPILNETKAKAIVQKTLYVSN